MLVVFVKNNIYMQLPKQKGWQLVMSFNENLPHTLEGPHKSIRLKYFKVDLVVLMSTTLKNESAYFWENNIVVALFVSKLSFL